MKPRIDRRERRISAGFAIGTGPPSYAAIIPHSAMRPNAFIRAIVASSTAPPTFSKQLHYRESIAHGLERAPEALIGLLKGHNFGKQLVQLV